MQRYYSETVKLIFSPFSDNYAAKTLSYISSIFCGLILHQTVCKQSKFQPSKKPQSYRYLKTCSEIAARFCRQPPTPSYLETPETQFSCKCLAILQRWPNMAVIYVVKI